MIRPIYRKYSKRNADKTFFNPNILYVFVNTNMIFSENVRRSTKCTKCIFLLAKNVQKKIKLQFC